MYRGAVVAVVLGAAVLGLPGGASAATFAVTRTDDAAGTCNAGDCTLRQAVQAANANPGADEISVPAGTFTISLDGTRENAAADGDLDVTETLTITGAGSGSSVITSSLTGEPMFQALASTGSLTIQDLALNGADPSESVAVLDSAATTTTLRRTEVSGNRSDGGILAAGGPTFNLEASQILGNTSDGQIIDHFPSAGGTLNVVNSTIKGNHVPGGSFATIMDVEALSVGHTLNISGSVMDGNVLDTTRGEGLIDFNPSGNDSNSAVHISDSRFSNNRLKGGEGVLQFDPAARNPSTMELTVDRSTFAGNVSEDTGNGAAIGFYPASPAGAQTARITDSSFLDNVAGSAGNGRGGAIDWSPSAEDAQLSISGTTFAGNRAGTAGPDTSFSQGGAINFDAGLLDVVNSTFSGNRVEGATFASNGGGALDLGQGTKSQLTNVTIADNSVQGLDPHGGGILSPDRPQTDVDVAPGGVTTVIVTNSIVAGNTVEREQQAVRAAAAAAAVPEDCFGIVGSGGHNIESGVSCDFDQAGDKQNTDPKLAALADNGGPTQTRAIGKDSPAFDAGDNAKCPGTDQRGVSRPQFAACDIGAFELAAPAPPQQQPQQQGGAAPQGGVLGASTHKCVSRRHFRIRLRVPRGERAVKAVVRVNGKRVAVRRGHRLTSIVSLRGLPKGRFRVRITLTLASGRTISGIRVYHTCIPAQNDGIPPRV